MKSIIHNKIALSLLLSTMLLNATEVGDAHSFDSSISQPTNQLEAYQVDIDKVTQIIEEIPRNLEHTKQEYREINELNRDLLSAIDLHLRLSHSYSGSNNPKFKQVFDDSYNRHNPGSTLERVKSRVQELKSRVQKKLYSAQQDADSIEGYHTMLKALKAQKSLLEKVEKRR